MVCPVHFALLCLQCFLRLLCVYLNSTPNDGNAVRHQVQVENLLNWFILYVAVHHPGNKKAEGDTERKRHSAQEEAISPANMSAKQQIKIYNN